MIISAVISIAHAKIGILPSVMPGARVNSTPMISSMAPAIAEISMNPIPSRYQSAPMPAEYWLVSGGYMNQPPSGATPKKIVMKNAVPPNA